MATELLSVTPQASSRGESWARFIAAAARIALGAVFFASGLNGFFHFLTPPAMNGNAAKFMEGLLASGYVFPVLFATYIVAGGALLVNRFVPLALILLAPAIVNIFAVHVLLVPHGLALAIVVVALEIFVAWCHREAYRPLFRARA